MSDVVTIDLSSAAIAYRPATGEQRCVAAAEVSPAALFRATPWRTFRWYLGQRHYSGTYWSATEGGHVIYESRLELANLVLADFDPTVHHIAAQPFRLSATVDNQERRHIPDYLWVSPNKGREMNRDQMVELWDRHASYEFAVKDANLAVSTMVDDARVMHLPTMSGGFGKENLRHYYADIFIPGIPADTTSELVARSVGDSLVVDELIMRMTHDQHIPFLLPGLAPTGKTVELAMVAIVKFRGDLMESERLYWDQAAVLSQLGLIDQSLPFADVTEVSGFLRDDVLR
jgi:carboxymethylenebutenolidase